jgi:hypothetical protein
MAGRPIIYQSCSETSVSEQQPLKNSKMRSIVFARAFIAFRKADIIGGQAPVSNI